MSNLKSLLPLQQLKLLHWLLRLSKKLHRSSLKWLSLVRCYFKRSLSTTILETCLQDNLLTFKDLAQLSLRRHFRVALDFSHLLGEQQIQIRNLDKTSRISALK
jgi:hypothetical protein